MWIWKLCNDQNNLKLIFEHLRLEFLEMLSWQPASWCTVSTAFQQFKSFYAGLILADFSSLFSKVNHVKLNVNTKWNVIFVMKGANMFAKFYVCLQN